MTINLAKADPAKCHEGSDVPTDIANIAAQIATDNAYHGLDDSAFKQAAITNQIASHGNTQSGITAAADNKGCGDAGGYSGSNFITIAKTTVTPPDLRASTEAYKEGANCISAAAASSPDNKLVSRKRLTAILCEARNTIPTVAPSIKELTVGDVLSMATAQQAAITALGQTRKEGDSEQGKNAVKKLLGSDESAKIPKFFEVLETADLKLSQDKGARKTSIKAAAQSDGYGLALAHFSGQALKRTEEAAKSVTKATQVKEEDCTSKGKDDCTSEKCVVKDGVKVGNDGTTDSTCTGKKRGECEKDTGCKWDGNACKDSSFIVNRKLALMAAAFVSFLFSGFLPIFMKLVKICYFERVC
ncbi:Trypanosome variant surface glycoprotein C-terminal domain containing protein, putative [Trypanosoma equiperdum]|uniref:Trypanosome variant surface glycoprotein C-terminal domain containing protein, putative n=1 Tax=Trypanosoma equiperdum TaxID=5694 RepID=A0A1G4I6P0_TRYEQ|nr:Trypanosome variant surface glycoprotein C-terminal domain containing protein, putative [Trypanosoma equiperdum]